MGPFHLILFVSSAQLMLPIEAIIHNEPRCWKTEPSPPPRSSHSSEWFFGEKLLETFFSSSLLFWKKFFFLLFRRKLIFAILFGSTLSIPTRIFESFRFSVSNTTDDSEAAEPNLKPSVFFPLAKLPLSVLAALLSTLRRQQKWNLLCTFSVHEWIVLWEKHEPPSTWSAVSGTITVTLCLSLCRYQRLI